MTNIRTLNEVFPCDKALNDIGSIQTVHAVGSKQSLLSEHDRATSCLLSKISKPRKEFGKII